MITLAIRKYCHDCPNFDVRHDIIFYDNQANHTITCAHSEQCERMKEYLEKNVVTNPLSKALEPVSDGNHCVICGVDIPKGKVVCLKCQEGY